MFEKFLVKFVYAVSFFTAFIFGAGITLYIFGILK